MSMGPTCSRIVEVICGGTPYDMGLAQGVGVKAKIHGVRRALAKLEAFRLQQPRWLPYGMYRWLAEGKAARLLAAPLARDHPGIRERLAGIAEGSGTSSRGILLLNALEPVLSSAGGCTACPGACSAVAVRGRRSATGEPMIARNFDYLSLVQPFYLMRDSRPAGRLRALEFTAAPLAGTLDGLNEAGLCVTYNYGFATDEPATPSVPPSMVISEALQRCRTVSEDADFIGGSRRWGGGLLMLADASGDIASLELTSTRSHVRRPASGEDALCHTNAFTSPHTREVQVPWDAVYTQRAPTPLRGRRLHQSSDLRDRRFKQLLDQTAVIDAEGLAAIMADHGPDGTPGDYTPCVHGSYWSTTACLQFFPASRRLRVSYTAACQARFEELAL